MIYNPAEIEKKWQEFWFQNKTFNTQDSNPKEKFYILDMFPYPSGAGLHVGHPLGYIASDIYARFKRHQGFNVLHPMGFDSFGLPAEQYAIQNGQHPNLTTKVNIEGGLDKQGNSIAGYKKQLNKIGLAYDWEREIRTSNPNYYKWTQWIFIQLFNHYYNYSLNKADNISNLIMEFEANGNTIIKANCNENTPLFNAQEWNEFTTKLKEEILLKYRLTFLAEAEVNWCAALGTVLANDEVINGLSERGGHQVEKKKMTQWMMRITAYSERLLTGLDALAWSDSIKESQKNWIGKSKGASVFFNLLHHKEKIEVFTTRPDTLFGVTFLTLSPEHPLVGKITTESQAATVEAYLKKTSLRTERERLTEVNAISGVNTGAFVEHPFTKEQIPVWVSDYVLASYGTGAVMAVPAGDERDFKFANFFTLPIKNIFNQSIENGAFTKKDNTFCYKNSTFLNGLNYTKATEVIIEKLEEQSIGKGKINYRLRDAVFSRQRYWGEPVPIYFKEGIPVTLPEDSLPLQLPEINEYLPTESGEPPLGRAKKWAWDSINKKVVSNELIDQKNIFPLELNTMPGWAGSSCYWMRYMDANNNKFFASKEALDYWQNVDLYFGGSEHATGHLLYSRFWNKFLKDIGLAPTEEPFKKLINQGMILGMSAFAYRFSWLTLSSPEEGFDILSPKMPSFFITKSRKDKILAGDSNELEIIKNFYIKVIKEIFSLTYFAAVGKIRFTPTNIDVSFVNGSDELNINAFKNWREYYNNAIFVGENSKAITLGEDLGEVFKVVREVEKMSKSKYNVVSPDAICEEFGADTLRLYEMFLGPVEQSKPWNTQGLSGVSGFLKKFWRLFHNEAAFYVSNDSANKTELKILHETIKKVTESITTFSFNTAVSAFMIATNELSRLKSNKKEILEPLLVLLSPYAPHISEELWQKLGKTNSISSANWPNFDAKYLEEDNKEYPVSFNGKTRFSVELPITMNKEDIEKLILEDQRTIKQLEGKVPKKIIVVLGKIINIVN
ncbi:MAG: leucine--tRNA ligase [Solirubrobacteraceae bacterium]